jgi:hypothetical protein
VRKARSRRLPYHQRRIRQCRAGREKGIWRTFDLTRYVQQDVLQGRWQNNGLLMRVTKGEPDFYIRFDPEADVEAAKDI